MTVDRTGPTATNVTSTTTNGTYTVGAVIDVQVDFNENVFVDTTGGTPTILLETGAIDRTAIYVSGSGTSSLHFSYTVQPGDLSSDLDYASINALVLNGGTLHDTAGNNASLTLPTVAGANSLAGNKNIVIDTTADLSVTKTDGVTSVTAGDGVVRTYTVTVSNAGPAPATLVDLADTFPSGFTRGTVTPDQGSATRSATRPTSAASSAPSRPAVARAFW